jgi:hypothetical protein
MNSSVYVMLIVPDALDTGSNSVAGILGRLVTLHGPHHLLHQTGAVLPHGALELVIELGVRHHRV